MAGMIFTRGHVQTYVVNDIVLEEKAWEQHVGITISMILTCRVILMLATHQ